MTNIDSKLLWKFVKEVGEKLTGDWILIGGTVLPILGLHHRVTLDIDIIGPEQSTQKDTLRLMKLTETLGLPVEAINQAGALFLYRVPHWRKHLVKLHSGKHATIHRPDATLFFLLKVARMTESDLSDCLVLLKAIQKSGEKLEKSTVVKAIQGALRKSSSIERTNRLRALLERIDPG